MNNITRIEKLTILSLIGIVLGIMSLTFIILNPTSPQQKSYCERTTNLCWDLTAIIDKDPNTNTILEYNRR